MYDYYEAVKEDVLNYIKDEVDMKDMDLNELRERLYENCMNADCVTGNLSGSYTFSQYEAQKYVEENKDLVREMCEELNYSQTVMNWWYTDDYEFIDVALRCYVLCSAIDRALEELNEAAK